MGRVALKVQYVGSQFYGWQRQSHHRSVQADLEDAIASRVNHPVIIHGAGRTDTGVHALGQVAHFDTHSRITAAQWRLILNNCLPDDIVIRASVAVPWQWHARFSAEWRQYRYLIWNDPLPHAFWRLFSWQVRQPLDIQPMQAALTGLRGEHDLDVFRMAGSKRKDSWVQVHQVRCDRDQHLISIDVRARGFLYGMMRLLVGSLVKVGSGELSVADFEATWRSRTQPPVRFSAPAAGLCLTGVGYTPDPFASDLPAQDSCANAGQGDTLVWFPFGDD